LAPGAAWAQQASAADTEALGEVIVTGSRVITNGNDSPTPVTVVSTFGGWLQGDDPLGRYYTVGVRLKL
jgi:hypothetical protein